MTHRNLCRLLMLCIVLGNLGCRDMVDPTRSHPDFGKWMYNRVASVQGIATKTRCVFFIEVEECLFKNHEPVRRILYDLDKNVLYNLPLTAIYCFSTNLYNTFALDDRFYVYEKYDRGIPFYEVNEAGVHKQSPQECDRLFARLRALSPDKEKVSEQIKQAMLVQGSSLVFSENDLWHRGHGSFAYKGKTWSFRIEEDKENTRLLLSGGWFRPWTLFEFKSRTPNPLFKPRKAQ